MSMWVALLAVVWLLWYLFTQSRRPSGAVSVGPSCFACGHGTVVHLDPMQKCPCCAQDGLPEPV